MWLLAGLAVLSLAACATVGGSDEPRRAARTQVDERRPVDRAAQTAASMVGKPYKYGGSNPAGFDCSGLVQFSFRQAGISLPRSTEEQRRAARKVRASGLQPGDLLFFDQEGKKHSHVGIYLGDGRFVHAPSSGGRVRTDSLSAEFWKKHFVEARRV